MLAVVQRVSRANVRIKENPSIKFKLLYDRNNNLSKRILLEKLKKR